MDKLIKKLVMELSSLIKAFENESGRKCTKATMSRGKNNADIMKLWAFDFEDERKFSKLGWPFDTNAKPPEKGRRGCVLTKTR